MATLHQQIESLPDLLTWQGEEYHLADISEIAGNGKRVTFLAPSGKSYMRFLFENNELIDWEQIEKDNGEAAPIIPITSRGARPKRELSMSYAAVYQRKRRKKAKAKRLAERGLKNG